MLVDGRLKEWAKIGLFFFSAAVGGFFRPAECWSIAVEKLGQDWTFFLCAAVGGFF